jgi:hypothetical protein
MKIILNITIIMQNYINLLIEDLQDAKSHAPESPEFSDIYDEFEEQMLAIENAPDKSFDSLMGITYQQFPPSTMLNEEQIRSVIDALEDAFDAFNMSIDLPDEVPLIVKYELIRELFTENTHYMPGFTNHFDFCSGYCSGCKIAEYCKNRIEDY